VNQAILRVIFPLSISSLHKAMRISKLAENFIQYAVMSWHLRTIQKPSFLELTAHQVSALLGNSVKQIVSYTPTKIQSKFWLSGWGQRLLKITGDYWRLLEITGDYWRLPHYCVAAADWPIVLHSQRTISYIQTAQITSWEERTWLNWMWCKLDISCLIEVVIQKINW